MFRRPVCFALLTALFALIALSSASAALLSAPPASAGASEPSPPPSPTATPALTLAVTPAELTAGAATRLTAGLGIAGATLRLSQKAATAADFSPVCDLVTDETGGVSYTARPSATVTYRVDYAGDAEWLPASAEITVTVRPRIRLSATKAVYRGRRATFAVRVAPAHPGASVILEVYRDGAWTMVSALTLGDDSRARSRWQADKVGRQPFRARMDADLDHVAGESAVRKVIVRRPNPYHVPITLKRIIVVDLSKYRLYFFSHGRRVRSFPCVLGRPSLPTPRGHFKIYARGMWPGGPYGARIMSYHPPCAIHGTNEPGLLKRFPRNFSHGCTRLYNSDAIWLYDHSPIGTPVWNVP